MYSVRCVAHLTAVLVLASACFFPSVLAAWNSSALAAVPVVLIDPNAASSESNHHVAGYALVGVGVLVIASLLSPNSRRLQYVWPILFLCAGLFLVFWSDREMWPRGNMSWAWLLRHDQEARQHKIYAFLLLAMGVVEYLRVCGRLGNVARVWFFPLLAVLGAGLLLFHDHSHASDNARSPEARVYYVNSALDPDGNPRSDSSLSGVLNEPTKMDHSLMAMEEHAATHIEPSTEAEDAAGTKSQHVSEHHHEMTASMLLVKREHFWFMVVGLGIALFKFLSDAGIKLSRFSSFVWPSGMVLLGALLIFYRE